MSVWVALMVWGGREMSVARGLVAAGIAAYVPTGLVRTVPRRHCRQAGAVRVPVMPGYVFGAVEPTNVGPLRRAERDVLGVVAADGVPLVVPPSDVARMREMEAAGHFDEAAPAAGGRRRTTLRVGDKVTVFGGPFEGWDGIIRDLAGKAGNEVAVIPLGTFVARVAVDRLVAVA